jgi:lysozyme family protein
VPYDIEDAINYVLHWEDATLSGKVTTDKGGKTRFGLSQRGNPDLTDENFFSLPKAEALAKAREIYKTRYARVVHANEINNEAVRAKVLDMYVNMGVHGVKIIQRAVGQVEDGSFGPLTLAGVNGVTPTNLTLRLANMSCAYYDTLDGTPAEKASWRRRGRCMGILGVNTPFFEEITPNG